MTAINLAPLPGEVIECLRPRDPEPGPTPREPLPRAPETNRNGRARRWAEKALAEECASVANKASGRNDELNRAAFSLGQIVAGGLLSEIEVSAELTEAARQASARGDHPLTPTEIRNTIKSGLSKGAAAPRYGPPEREPRPAKTQAKPEGKGAHDSEDGGPLPEIRARRLTDLANAHRLRDTHGEDLRHSSALGWLCWDRKRWARSGKAVERRAHRLGAIIRREASELRDADAAKAFFAHAKYSEGSAGIGNALRLAQALDGIDADHVDFDADPWALNVTNGTLNLRTGELRPHRRADHLTKLAPLRYDPDAECPTWIAHLQTVFGGDQTVSDYFQFLCGYTLTGATHLDLFPILHGPRGTGKSTTIDTFKTVLGSDYATALDVEAIMMHRYARHTCDIAALRGARMVYAVEPSEGRRINEGLVKGMTGGDTMSARFMKQDPFEFSPTHKLWLGTNHKPVIRDDALFRRIRLIPFTVQLWGTPEDDPNIEDKLNCEREGILAWAVRGARQSAKGEPAIPDAVRAATAEYEAESDVIGEFLRECCIEDRHVECSKKALFAAWRDFTDGRGMGRNTFNKKIEDRGFDSYRRAGDLYWIGLRLAAGEAGE